MLPWVWWWQMWARLTAASITLVLTPDPATWRAPIVRGSHLTRVK